MNQALIRFTDLGNPFEYNAFQFANKVMAMQQAQSGVALHFRNKRERVEPSYKGEWRLFQITFFLMNINGVSDLEHEIVNLWICYGSQLVEERLKRI